MKTLAMITARGGSKRIPHKNIKDFLGRPIITYSIEAALNSGVFDTVMVSTDDEEIAEIAKKAGAEVPFFRSADASNDYATTSDVILEVLDTYAARDEHFDIAACIYPTAPFITDKKLQQAMTLLTKSTADTLFPVVRFSYPVQRSLIEKDGFLQMAHPEYSDTRSQDLPPHFHDAGQFYIFRTAPFYKNKRLTEGVILPFELPENEVQDIDTETDWQIAEMKYRLMQEGAHRC